MHATSPSTPPPADDRRRILLVRLLTAAFQAALLYSLLHTGAGEDAVKQAWQAANPRIYIPLLLATVYAPIAILLGAGHMRPRPLMLWTLVVAVGAAGLGYHDALRGGLDAHEHANGLPLPWFPLWLALSAAGFVGQVLMTDRYGEAAEDAAPPYVRHFNTAWRIGLQVVLAHVFLGVFWLVLYLGATLFETIGLPAPAQLIARAGFALPASTLAIAIAIHVTSIQSSLIRGIRLLVLTLFSWLLPLMSAIVAAFLASLLLRSLEPLWNTRYAASLLLGSAALMVFLINACYQDGSPGQESHRLRRWAAMLGAVELLPLVGLAIWALQLRVRQYGWSVDRIVAAAVCLMGAWYAVGYAASLIRARAWMKRLEATNTSAAYLFLALVAALFSPVADPARLMVSNQIARLQDGSVRPDQFDYSALYLEGGHWGTTALSDLADHASGPAADTIKQRARQALDAYTRNRDYVYHEPDAALLARTVDVLPAGRALPDALLKPEIWRQRAWGLPTCAYDDRARCTARYIELAPGTPEALLFIDNASRYLFQPDAQGRWNLVGSLEGDAGCDTAAAPIESADIHAVPAVLPDLMIGRQRMRIIPRASSCASTATRDAR
ncbi:DUF4153 domain-containing protein [Achromobacter aloeverae]|uniref:DUF4153 domain-containing protein n=1 Tax=Achromobacter aloeverae TaxID=1750518 RepID=A0A4Q1HQP9_9BURK|nr:DUF4153 domain-containing protein [Achromobacter aloeverae]RXN93289.1 hypothetical protein C7R54_06215 [Achromobacter aloeverae]